jgi:hypothetical protein
MSMMALRRFLKSKKTKKTDCNSDSDENPGCPIPE